MQNELILFTKTNCKACEIVKSFLEKFVIPAGTIQIRDITNDLVMISNLKDGIPGVKDGKEETFTSMTFPSLMVKDKATLNVIDIIAPSTAIVEYLSTLGFTPVEKPAE